MLNPMFHIDFLKFTYFLISSELKTHCWDFRWTSGPEGAPFAFLQFSWEVSAPYEATDFTETVNLPE